MKLVVGLIISVLIVGGATAAFVVTRDDGGTAETTIPRSNSVKKICNGVGAGGWSYTSYVSDNDGLILGRSSLGRIQLSHLLSAPYLVAKVNGKDVKVELTPTPELAHDGVRGTTLAEFECQESGDGDIWARATFTIDRLTEAANSGPLKVIQEYRFRGRDGEKCEPTGELACARFWPSLSYFYRGDLSVFGGLTTVQRMEFRPRGVARGGIDAIKDTTELHPLGVSSVETKGSDKFGSSAYSSMKYEDTGRAIRGGKRSRWDNIHQATTARIPLPGTNVFRLAAGCPECVHIHWAWGRSVNLASRGFTNGEPEILPTSKQDADFGIVRASADRDEIDPVEQGWRSLVDDQSPERDLRGNAPVIFWEMRSASKNDATFPLLDDTWTGGNGAIFFGASHVHSIAEPTIPSTPSSPSTPVSPIDRYIGEWAGNSGQNPPSDFPYQTAINLYPDGSGMVGDVSYPELACGGTLTSLGATEEGWSFREDITYGDRRCIASATVTLIESNGRLRFVWSGQSVAGEHYDAWADLAKVTRGDAPPVGTWSGGVRQTPASSAPYSIRLSVGPQGGSSSPTASLTGTVNYPELGCSGTVTEVGSMIGVWTFQEFIDQGSCTDGGFFSLTPQADGTVTWAYSNSPVSSEASASATLTPTG